ncbi:MULTISPECIES: nitroreductase family protein [Pelosinus]|jgi:nitroreductase|uniref:Nitroreductase n=1 Tax=Pelosinus fermentans B4 TaxID=1149862 RepID=I9L5N5_9FIRM|nr:MULTISPECIES: nitroreductase family protein [Pelosinus]EIW15674.1 nitroreductase [Pelosinus fermentans B4]EIW26636.1 nitroreductase [Pelosinus fermentans A11]OAM92419.1 nitroreductase [Pelosinus fermentans DSM 17108]SDQ44227.1 Nitroreductase [Pelosinus fermentans]
MNEIIKTILTRKSTRSYKEDQMLDSDLELLIDAAIHAPTGGNSQSWNFTVIQNKEKLLELNSLVKESFANLIVDENTYRSKRTGKISSQQETYSFYYNAPTLIIVSNAREYSNAMADCSAAIENILLAAKSLGLASCWINQLTWFCDEEKMRKTLTDYGIPENYIVCGAVALGYSASNDDKLVPRKKADVNIIR